MKAIYKEPNERPKIIDIDNTLEAMQDAVDGYIETVTIASDVCIVCNENGRLFDLPFNCNICGVNIVGPLLIVGVDDDVFTDLHRPECVARMFFGDGCL